VTTNARVQLKDVVIEEAIDFISDEKSSDIINQGIGPNPTLKKATNIESEATGLVSGLFNNSNNALVTYVGGLVLFIVLLEIVLFALDVYYNNTYTSYSNFSQRYDNGGDSNSAYQDYPPYPDPYISTYRSYSSWNFSKILEWISLMNDSYDMADSTVHHFDCQKRAVCEMFRPDHHFKMTEILNNVLEMSDVMNWSDDVQFIIDELEDARNDAKNEDLNCEDLYDRCSSKSLGKILYKMNNLLLK